MREIDRTTTHEISQDASGRYQSIVPILMRHGPFGTLTCLEDVPKRVDDSCSAAQHLSQGFPPGSRACTDRHGQPAEAGCAGEGMGRHGDQARHGGVKVHNAGRYLRSYFDRGAVRGCEDQSCIGVEGSIGGMGFEESEDGALAAGTILVVEERECVWNRVSEQGGEACQGGMI